MKTSYADMNATANTIEAVLTRHRAPAQVLGGRVTSTQFDMQLALAPGTRVAQVRALMDDLKVAVGAPAIDLAQHGRELVLRLARRNRRPALHLNQLLAQRPCTPAPLVALGMSVAGAPLFANLASPQVSHILIAGATGCGKTELAHSMLVSITGTQSPRKAGVIVLDPKQRADGLLRSAIQRHLLLPVAHGIEHCIAALHHAQRIMDQHVPGVHEQPLLVVLVDEAADLCLRGGYEMRAGLARLAMRGREHGVHLWLCTQKPDARIIGAEVKANLPLRLIGRMASVEDARLAAGRPGSSAERLRHAGQFVAVNGDQMVQFDGPLWKEP